MSFPLSLRATACRFSVGCFSRWLQWRFVFFRLDVLSSFPARDRLFFLSLVGCFSRCNCIFDLSFSGLMSFPLSLRAICLRFSVGCFSRRLQWRFVLAFNGTSFPARDMLVAFRSAVFHAGCNGIFDLSFSGLMSFPLSLRAICLSLSRSIRWLQLHFRFVFFRLDVLSVGCFSPADLSFSGLMSFPLSLRTICLSLSVGCFFTLVAIALSICLFPA